MNRAKEECPRCGRAMRQGERAVVNLRWEYGEKKHVHMHNRPPYDAVSVSTIVCRACAREISEAVRVYVPEEVIA